MKFFNGFYGTLVEAFPVAILYKMCNMYIPSLHLLKSFCIPEKVGSIVV